MYKEWQYPENPNITKQPGKAKITKEKLYYAMVIIGMALGAGSVAVGYTNISHWELVMFVIGAVLDVTGLRGLESIN